MSRRKHAFTLIEMLVVIVIIMVLAGLLFPALAKAREAAKIRRARGEIRELIKAWNQYYHTYPTFPYSANSWITMDSNTVAVLVGENTGLNPHNIRFIDLKPAALGEGFKDPWGHLYEFQFRPDNIATTWVYETKVQFPNNKRYVYD